MEPGLVGKARLGITQSLLSTAAVVLPCLGAAVALLTTLGDRFPGGRINAARAAVVVASSRFGTTATVGARLGATAAGFSTSAPGTPRAAALLGIAGPRLDFAAAVRARLGAAVADSSTGSPVAELADW